jgi:hypothetical protein
MKRRKKSSPVERICPGFILFTTCIAGEDITPSSQKGLNHHLKPTSKRDLPWISEFFQCDLIE